MGDDAAYEQWRDEASIAAGLAHAAGHYYRGLDAEILLSREGPELTITECRKDGTERVYVAVVTEKRS